MHSETAVSLNILGVHSYGSAETLKAAYRQLVKQWHPDRFHNDPVQEEVANEQMKLINAAYEHLSELNDYEGAHGQVQRPGSTSSSQERPAYRPQHVYRGEGFVPGFPDPDVVEVFIKSSHLVSTGYNRKTRTLYLKFMRNAVYAYLDVPETVFLDFLAAESHGKFAHRCIYGHYKMSYC